MPLYDFECKKCKEHFEEFSKYDESGKYPGIVCPKCKSKRKAVLPPKVALKFADPKTSSKWESFSYRAGYNMEKAQGERRAAEAASHMGTNPYNTIDDTPLDIGIHDREG
jgi:putative FmdB family regulatory protein